MVPRPAVRLVAVGLAAVTGGWLLLGCSATPASLSTSGTPSPVATQSAAPSLLPFPPTPTPPTTSTPLPTPSPSPAWTVPAGSAAAALSVESVTFVSPEEGWVLGTLPCSASPQCLGLLRTEDGGQSWVSVTPPPTYPYPAASADGGVSGGVSEVRFANSQDGWVFGPDLWSTHNGGATWTQIPIAGPASTQYVVAYHSVANLETSDGFVYALVSNGDGFEIETSPIGVDAWTESSTTLPLGASGSTFQMVLQGASGWIIDTDPSVSGGIAFGGVQLVGGQWVAWQPPCMQTNGPVNLAASTESDLIAVCNEGLAGPSTLNGVYAYASTNGGETFHLVSNNALPSSTVGFLYPGQGDLASPSPDVAVLVGDAGLVATFDGGATWSTVDASPTGSGPQYVGFETSAQGVAIWTNDERATPIGSLQMTFDGGHDWTPVTL